MPGARIAAQEETLAQVGAGPELLRPLPADGERVARVGHRLEVLERAVVVGGGDLHAGPAPVGPALLVDDLLGRPAQLAVALGRERLAEEDDLLGRELAAAAEAGRCEAQWARVANLAYLLMKATLERRRSGRCGASR